MVLYLLMTFTRNIALLVGVLHLNEKAVSDVLQHMELVKRIRQRIHETLANTKIVHGIARPEEAAQKLENAEKGEVAILKLLGAKGKKDRVTSAEIQGMVKDHKEHMTMTEDDLKNFLGAFASDAKGTQGTDRGICPLASPISPLRCLAARCAQTARRSPLMSCSSRPSR